MSQLPQVSIIIPAYNEEEGLKITLDKLQGLIKGKSWEVIVVDDGSTDNTFNIACGFAFVKILRHKSNKGNGASLKTGLRSCVFETIVFMDADGQHDPDKIPEFLEEINCCDMVVGSRTKYTHNGWMRKTGKWFLSKLANYLSDAKIPDVNCGFRAVRKKCVEKFIALYPDGFSMPTALTMALIKTGHRVKFIPIPACPRIGRKSTVNIACDGIKVISLMLKCTMYLNPLKICLPISFFLFVIGTPFVLYSIKQKHNIQYFAFCIILFGLVILLYGFAAKKRSTIRSSQ